MKKEFEKILERLEEMGKHIKNTQEGTWFQLGFNVAKQIVQEVAEQYNDGWILCSERLPEDKGKYLVCDNKGNVYSSEYYFNCWLVISPTDEVIAWQSLPDPYKE